MADSKVPPVSNETDDFDKVQILDSNEMKTQSHGSKELNDSLSVASSGTDTSSIVAKSFGIRKSELIMAQMTNWWMKGFFFFTIFIGMYIMMMENDAVRTFLSYATNSYKQHSLMSTIGIIRSVVAAASLPFFARLSDNFGRFELFIVALIFRIIGLLIQSQASDVQKYAAGTVFYGFGNAGMRILWQINLSDASSLRWRLVAIGVLSLQTIINTWSVGEVTSTLLERHSWSFGIALWAFTTPLVCLPYMLFFLFLIMKARRTDSWKQIRQEERDSFIEGSASAKRYHLEMLSDTTFAGKLKGHTKLFGVRLVQTLHAVFWKVDFIGCLLAALVFGFILVPLTLAGGINSKWLRASTIVPLVIGFVLIPVFIVWEAKITKRPMVPFKVMKDRGIWAAFAIGIFSTLNTGMANDYAYPVLLVGMNASKVVAQRTPTLNYFVEGVTMPILGFVLSKVRRTKAFIIFGNFMLFIAMGLFVHFRGTNDGYRAKYYRDGVAIGMCFVGFAQVFIFRVVSVSVQSCTNHEYMATVTALFASFYQIGSALSSSVSGAIWTQDMYGTIRGRMEELNVDTSLATLAYQKPYDFIAKYAWGTDPRRAISLAYADVQKKMCIVGLCLCVPMLCFILLLRDNKLTDDQNLDDAAIDPEMGVTAADRGKSRVIFDNDKDYILDFLKRLVGIKPKTASVEN